MQSEAVAVNSPPGAVWPVLAPPHGSAGAAFQVFEGKVERARLIRCDITASARPSFLNYIMEPIVAGTLGGDTVCSTLQLLSTSSSPTLFKVNF